MRHLKKIDATIMNIVGGFLLWESALVYRLCFTCMYRLAQKEGEPPPSRNRPLYDIPYMFEAREFMRKKLIGKKVNK